MRFFRKLAVAYVYFRRGYGQIAFVLSFTNFIIISYKLLVEPMLHLPESPLMLLIYALTVGLAIVLACIFVGRWDIKRGTYKVESLVYRREDIFTRDLFLVLQCIAHSDTKCVDEVVKKWMHEAAERQRQ